MTAECDDESSDERLNGEDEYASDSEGAVHPHPLARPVAQEHADEKLSKRAPLSSRTSESDNGSSVGTIDESKHTTHIQPYSDEIVRLHASRNELRHSRASVHQRHLVAPPPPPAPFNIVDIGPEAAVEAQRRVAEYRRRLAEKEEEQKNQKTRQQQQLKQIKAMHKEFNRAMGVADVPPEERFKEALRAKRMDKKKKEQAATEATAARWYRRIVRTTRSEYNAADFGAKILEDAKREHHFKLNEKELHRRAISKKLKQLSLEAKTIVTQSVGGYERGSFILRVPPKGKQKVQTTDLESMSARE